MRYATLIISGTRIGSSPRDITACLATYGVSVMTNTGTLGLYLLTSLAGSPCPAITTIILISSLKDILHAANAMDSMLDHGFLVFTCMYAEIASLLMKDSASRAVSSMTRTASSGYLPLAVSPESMTQSAPSTMALPTSETSARVGRGLTTMDSSIWVATMTGLAARLHLRMMDFWATKTFAGGISIPRSPRATITPSVAARMASKLSRPSWFSILEKILMCFPSSPRTARTSWTCFAVRMKEAKIMSTFCSTPKRRSPWSFSETAGRVTFAPGRLTPLCSPSMPVLSATQVTASAEHWTTSRLMRPSSM
mmetsp:Transcript_6758/g.16420  ORF Transcript_6758/g.16420 Transcript_6758/m.16420 type:complete len:310 (+) Transcript_6758:793-1722(+)